MKETYTEIEKSILSCVLQKPELINKVTLEDKYFINYNRLWKAMKAFYKQYDDLDIVLMGSLFKPQYKFMIYMQELIEIEPIPERITQYQEMLMKLCDEDKTRRIRINRIYDMANELVVGGITIEEFAKKVNEIASSN